MYETEETVYFDPNATGNFSENVALSVDTLSYQAASAEDDRVVSAAAMEIVNQGFNVENSYNTINGTNFQVLSFDQSNWDPNEALQGIYSGHHHQIGHNQDQLFPQMELQNANQSYHSIDLDPNSYPTPDLLNLLHLPRNSASNSPITFSNTTQKTTNLQNPSNNTNVSSSVVYDPYLHLNPPADAHNAPPALRELFQSFPHGYALTASRNDQFVFGGGDIEREGSGILAYQDGDGKDFDNGVLEFTQNIVSSVGKRGEGKRVKQFTSSTEKQRRVDLTSKFDALRELIPNPTKNDRASVVGDAIEYIKELLRTVKELKLLVDKKRCGKERIKRQKVEEDNAAGDLESCNLKPLGTEADDTYNNGGFRSSWLQRKSKDTEVDVRIIDDEVTIKLVQRKKINCLLYASKVLDELELDLQHVAGGHIGDFCSFLFNSKIYEGSSVYASAIANKLIEVMDRSFAAA